MAKDISSVNDGRSPTLQPHLRVFITVFAICSCVALASVAYIETGGGRVVPALLCVAFATVTAENVLRETRVVQNCLSTEGTITDYRESGRGAHVRYRFIAVDGAEYKGNSFCNPRELALAGPIDLAYNSHNPDLNLPLRKFVFYDCGISRQLMGARGQS